MHEHEECTDVVEYDGRVLWRAPDDAFGPHYAAKSPSAKRLFELVEVTYGSEVFGGANAQQNDGRCANKAPYGAWAYVDT
jgi:hypothetical protein